MGKAVEDCVPLTRAGIGQRSSRCTPWDLFSGLDFPCSRWTVLSFPHQGHDPILPNAAIPCQPPPYSVNRCYILPTELASGNQRAGDRGPLTRSPNRP